jgi:hypothetical protein
MDGLLSPSDLLERLQALYMDIRWPFRLELVEESTRKRRDAQSEESGDRINLQLDFSMDFLELASNKSAMAPVKSPPASPLNESAWLFTLRRVNVATMKAVEGYQYRSDHLNGAERLRCYYLMLQPASKSTVPVKVFPEWDCFAAIRASCYTRQTELPKKLVAAATRGKICTCLHQICPFRTTNNASPFLPALFHRSLFHPPPHAYPPVASHIASSPTSDYRRYPSLKESICNSAACTSATSAYPS